MTRRRAVRVLGGLALLVVLAWRVGPQPFREAAGHLSPHVLLLGLALGVPTTLCCAWRWRLVAGRLGTRLSMREAVAACYRSQVVNVALPLGVAGDVHRGYRHGLRAVVWERAAGQAVLVAVTAVALLVSPAGTWVPLVAALVLTGVAVLSSSRIWPRVVLASIGALLGPLATFLVAARSAGVTAPAADLLPLALIALLAMAVPLNVAGWGPREGVTAWAFSAAGLGAGTGLTTALVYGVMTMVAVLPGAVVLLAGGDPWRTARTPS